jgi:5-methylcytosine-specific restriction endonuclease McrA
MAEYYANPENKARIAAAQRLNHAKPEVKARIAAAQRLNYAKPEVKAEVNKRLRDLYATPEGRTAKLKSCEKWRLAHPEKVALKTRRYRNRKLRLEGFHTFEELEEVLIEQLCRCPYCGESLKYKYSVDHIIPVSREGSSDYIYNIQLLCTPCNSGKGDKTHEEYVTYLKER